MIMGTLRIFNCVLVALFVIVIFSLIVAEETPFSIENNKVVKMFSVRRTSKPGTIINETKGSFNNNWNGSGILNEFQSIMRTEVGILKKLVVQIKEMNNLNEIIGKCISSIKRKNELKSQKHWDQIIQILDMNMNEEEGSNILHRITVEAYDGFRENIIPVVQFINYTKDLSGLFVLLEEMREYGHIFGGTEVFLFARLIRTHCGTNSFLYQGLPIGIQYIDSYSVRLLNENNNGALFYKPKIYCRGRHCIPDEVFTYHLHIDDLPEKDRTKASWRFEPTNITEFSNHIKFNLRNEFGNRSYLYSTYYTTLSQIQKSIVIVQLVHNTEDAIRIRIEESHIIKRLVMGKQNSGSNTVVGLSIMYTEDRFEKANDGNWVVHPIEMIRIDEFNYTEHNGFNCEFRRMSPNKPTFRS